MEEVGKIKSVKFLHFIVQFILQHRPCNLLGEDDSASAAANESYARVDKWVREAKEEFEVREN